MERKTVRVKGISPLLMNRYPLEEIKAIGKKPPAEQAELKAYRTTDGMLYVPGVNMWSCLRNAGVYSKGKGRASLKKVVAACLYLEPQVLPLGTDSYELDSRRVVISSTRGAVIRHRPRLDEWELEFRISWDGELISEVQMREIADNAGSRVGILDFRPERNGPYGRFMVTEWTE